MKRSNREYQICKEIAKYLKLQYPKVIFRFDMAGLSLSLAQASMNKAIQHGKGYPDLFISEPTGKYHGLYLEIKKEGERLTKKDGEPINEHINEQLDYLFALQDKAYSADFAIGLDEAVNKINKYLSNGK